MPWEITYLESIKIVKTVYTEPVTLEELVNAAIATLKVAQEKDTHFFLGDCTELTENGSVLDIFKLGEFLESLKADWNIKEAVIAPKTRKNVIEDLSFFETVTKNRDIKVRLFLDENEAIRWLIGQPSDKDTFNRNG